MDGYDITARPAHLGPGATIEIEPTFTGDMDWFMGYGSRHDDEGAEGRLVMMSTQNESWTTWEMHPQGAELVLCVSGSITMHQEYPDGTVVTKTIGPSHYLINAPGVWHTADIDEESKALFITAGAGTEVRPR